MEDMQIDQSFKKIFSRKIIFAQITLTFILPLAIIFLGHREISRHFFHKIENEPLISVVSSNRRDTTVTDWLYYWLFEIAYFTLRIVFSLLSTAAVVFTIASVYTDREVAYRKVMKVVPKVWKRLFVTFLFIYVALFLYDLITDVAIDMVRSIFNDSYIGIIPVFFITIVYVIGFLYLSVVWQLASVVTVLENIQGFKAMRKGKDLLNGKREDGMAIAFALYGFLVGILNVYKWFVVYGHSKFELAMVWRVMIGILCVFLLMMLFLLFIVTHTVLYLVCKSHHREAVDNLSLSTFLDACVGETVMLPKVGEEIQLGRPQPQHPSQQFSATDLHIRSD